MILRTKKAETCQEAGCAGFQQVGGSASNLGSDGEDSADAALIEARRDEPEEGMESVFKRLGL